MKRISVLTGAGMSAESGIKTFRDADGLWEGYDVMQVASPEGWYADQALVLDFYNQRRRQLHNVKPNPGHEALTLLEEQYEVHIITQNIDDLHERAGSTNIVHLHGELMKARSTAVRDLRYDWPGDIKIGDTCEHGSQLRPDVVWFGEDVPAIQVAAQIVLQSDLVIIIGTSMLVYPAAGLVAYAPEHAEVFYVDPRPNVNFELARARNLKVIEKNAGQGVPELVDSLL